MERGKMSSTGRGGKSKAPQHPQDIFALGSKSTVVVSRDSEKRNIHKPSSSGVERKRETSTYGSQPPPKRSRIGSPAESVGGTSLEVDPVDLVPNVLQALDTHNSDKLLGLLTGSIRLLKSQRSKPDPILCMSMLYLTKIRPNMFAHDVVTQSLCTLLKREQGAAFKSKGNPLVFVLACNMLYAGHRDSTNWPDTFIKVYIEDALNERWWVDCAWCKCLVENIVTAFNTKQPPAHLIPTDNTLGTMSPSGSGSPLMGSTDEDTDITELEYTVFPRYSSSYETVEAIVLEAIKDQIQRRAAPDAIGKGFLKLLSATCGFPEIRMIAASRLEAWLHSGKLWRCGQELLAYVCANADASGPTAPRDHEVLAQLARMRLKTKPLQAAYQACLREMVSESPVLLGSVVTHTVYNELSAVRAPNNLAVLAALVHAQPVLVPMHMATTYQELLLRPEDYLRPLRALTRECARAARADVQALLPLVRALVQPPPIDPPAEVRERAFQAIVDLVCCCCMVTASHSKSGEARGQLASMQGAALGWLCDTAPAIYRPADYLPALNKIMFVEPAESYSKVDNWPPESERALIYRLCCETPLPQNSLLRIIFIGLSKEIPISATDVFELVEQLVRRACALPPEDNPLQVDKLEIVDYIFQLCHFNPPDNITLPAGYNAGGLCITSLYWRGWLIIVLLAAHNPRGFAERAAQQYPTLRALLEFCITGKPSIEWTTTGEAERAEAERAAILSLETHLATASNAKLPVTEHNSRLLSQLTTLDPLGPARKPPQAILDQLQQLNSQLRLGKLVCRQPALLLELVQRHGTRRAMPWLHQLLRQDQLELSVLPVQCLCEFVCGAGGGGPAAAGPAAAGPAAPAPVSAAGVARHVRRVAAASAAGARAVLAHYMTRLSAPQRPARDLAMRGLKLVLSQTDDNAELDYNGDASPETWLPLVRSLRQWPAVRDEVVAWIRRACLADCEPRHLAAYIAFLKDAADEQPDVTHHDLALDLSQVLMERSSVIARALPPPELESRVGSAADHQQKHTTLHALTTILYNHLKKVRVSNTEEIMETDDTNVEAGAEGAAGGEAVVVVWGGHRAHMQLLTAHAHLKLLCYGASMFDTNQEMYSYLESTWVGTDSPQAFHVGSETEAGLLPDWLRLQLVRSERPRLLDAGIRGMPAHKLALFIQTFGMPVASMSALLSALDACPAGAVARLGVERAYMSQLLSVQAARGASGGGATAAALRLQPPARTPDENLFEEEPLPEETSDIWSSAPAPAHSSMAPTLLETMMAEDHAGFTELLAKISEELKVRYGKPRRYLEAAVALLQAPRGELARRPARVALLLRALLPSRDPRLVQIGESLLTQYELVGGPVLAVAKKIVARPVDRQPGLPAKATREQLIAALEAATPSTLEALGSRIIETQEPHVIVDVITELLERNQAGYYEAKVKSEDGSIPEHVFSRGGLGCGLLLDWLSELQRETSAEHTDRQMKLMFVAGCAAWRPLLVALLAHRASWRTLHSCVCSLLEPGRGWSPRLVLQFAATVVRCGRVWPATSAAKHAAPRDLLRLTHHQLKVLVGYVLEEGLEAEAAGGVEAMRKCMEGRLDVVLRCAPSPRGLLAAALPARHPLLLTLLCMKVPKIYQLMQECEYRIGTPSTAGPPALEAACAPSTSPADTVSHTLLTQFTGHTHNKDVQHKWSRIENSTRALWSRVVFAGGRALRLAGALLRGGPAAARHPLHLLAALDVLPDETLHAEHNVAEVHAILECLIGMVGAAGGRDGALAHRTAALLRRYMASKAPAATHLIHAHRETLQSIPVVWGAVVAETRESWSSPPPHALWALQRRAESAESAAWLLQEVDSWVSRRGSRWGSGRARDTLLRCVAGEAGATRPAPRHAATQLLAKLLPAVSDTTPGLEAILECLDSNQPDVTQAMLDKLPEIIVGIQEHAAKILMKVFELGITSRIPVETCMSKCVATLNLNRGC